LEEASGALLPFAGKVCITQMGVGSCHNYVAEERFSFARLSLILIKGD
jgi:hypothetical protein